MDICSAEAVQSGPLAIAPPAFLFLFLRCQTARTEARNQPSGTSFRQAEVAAYIAAKFPVNTLFPTDCRKTEKNDPNCKFGAKISVAKP